MGLAWGTKREATAAKGVCLFFFAFLVGSLLRDCLKEKPKARPKSIFGVRAPILAHTHVGFVVWNSCKGQLLREGVRGNECVCVCVTVGLRDSRGRMGVLVFRRPLGNFERVGGIGFLCVFLCEPVVLQQTSCLEEPVAPFPTLGILTTLAWNRLPPVAPASNRKPTSEK